MYFVASRRAGNIGFTLLRKVSIIENTGWVLTDNIILRANGLIILSSCGLILGK